MSLARFSRQSHRGLSIVLPATATILVSVGHRPSILKYHPQVLELEGNGSWRLYSADDYRFNR